MVRQESALFLTAVRLLVSLEISAPYTPTSELVKAIGQKRMNSLWNESLSPVRLSYPKADLKLAFLRTFCVSSEYTYASYRFSARLVYDGKRAEIRENIV